jgi:putative peptide zinc metalloprotease protein
LLDAVWAVAGSPASSGRQQVGGEVRTVLPTSDALPREGDPRLALVLVPAGQDSTNPGSDSGNPAWVFPFNRPLPPEPGDNQAGAFNTTDHSAQYDVAIAMVWVTGEDPVLNVNEAYAFASCTDCVTVAVAFQVVVIVGRADVIVPQNLSAAVNYNCFACITAAIANQLVVTVDSLPGVEQQIALADVWAEIAAFAAAIPTMPLADVITRLEAYKLEILTILDLAPLPAPSSSPGPSVEPGASGAPTPSGGASPGASSPDPEPGATEAPTSTSPPPVVPGATHAPGPSPTPTPGPSSSPSGLLPSPTAS